MGGLKAAKQLAMAALEKINAVGKAAHGDHYLPYTKEQVRFRQMSPEAVVKKDLKDFHDAPYVLGDDLGGYETLSHAPKDDVVRALINQAYAENLGTQGLAHGVDPVTGKYLPLGNMLELKKGVHAAHFSEDVMPQEIWTMTGDVTGDLIRDVVARSKVGTKVDPTRLPVAARPPIAPAYVQTPQDRALDAGYNELRAKGLPYEEFSAQLDALKRKLYGTD